MRHSIPIRVLSSPRSLLIALWVGLASCNSAYAVPDIASAPIQLIVVDDSAHPLAGAEVVVSLAGKPLQTTLTGSDGHVMVSCPAAAVCTVNARLDGYQEMELQLLPGGSSTRTISLQKGIHVKEAVTVEAESESPLSVSQSGETKLSVQEAKQTPLRPATLADALPLIPGVIRTPDGQVNISGLGEHHSVLLVNAVDVTDPATGSFGLSVPIDTVESVKVLQSPYIAEYGNFTAGVVSAETKRGGDKWSYGLNDPMPELRIRSGHLVGLRAETPRLNLSGPIVPDHLYLLEGSEYLMHKDPVRTLPFPYNETKSQAINSFTQLDAPLTAKQTVTAALHFVPRSVQYLNLNYFDPQSVTPNADYHEDTGTMTHRLELRGGLLTSTYAYTRVATNVLPQAPGEMTLTPIGDSGNYFSQQAGESSRFQWIETFAPGVWSWKGEHSLQAGFVLAHAEDEGDISASAVHLADASGRHLQDIAYSGKGSYALSDLEPAAYIQDHWILSKTVALDAGIRWEEQTVTSTIRVAPRAGFTWSPNSDSHTTVLRGGMGVFYDQVPLNVYAFPSYPRQTVTSYGPDGQVTDGPRTFANLIGTDPNSNFPLIDQGTRSGNFAPHSLAWTTEAEHTFKSFTSLRVRYLQSYQQDQLTLRSEITPTQSALVLDGLGSGLTRQLELTSGFGRDESRHLYMSYVRQYSRGTQTDVTGYLGAYRYPVVRSIDQASNMGEIPNRFLLWGTFALPRRINIAPHLEDRDGFTFQPVNALQQYLSSANAPQARFPRFFSLDARVSKDVNLGPKHAVRLALNGINLTNHSNYLQVHNNTADPQYRTFFGNYGRHLLVDFDFLF